VPAWLNLTQAIGAALEAQGAAPELISLDLRDNNITQAGLERLVRGIPGLEVVTCNSVRSTVSCN